MADSKRRLSFAQIKKYEGPRIYVQWFKESSSDFDITGEPYPITDGRHIGPDDGDFHDFYLMSEHTIRQVPLDRVDEVAAFDLSSVVASGAGSWNILQDLYRIIWDNNVDQTSYTKTYPYLRWGNITSRKPREDEFFESRVDVGSNDGDFDPRRNTIWEYMYVQAMQTPAPGGASKWMYDKSWSPEQNGKGQPLERQNIRVGEIGLGSYKASTPETGLSFTSILGIRFTVVIQIRQRSNQARNMANQDVPNDQYLALVMFVEGTNNQGEPFTQQAGAWNATDIRDITPGDGLTVHGGVEIWNLNVDEIRIVKAWMESQQYTSQARSRPGPEYI